MDGLTDRWTDIDLIKYLKTADYVKIVHFGRLFENHFRLNEYFSKQFSDL